MYIFLFGWPVVEGSWVRVSYCKHELCEKALAVEGLESFYSDSGDVNKILNLSTELEFIAEEFEVERIVEACLCDKRTETPRFSQLFNECPRLQDVGQSSIEQRDASIQQEVSETEKEFQQIIEEFKQSFNGLNKRQHDVSHNANNMAPNVPATEDIVHSSSKEEEKSETVAATPANDSIQIQAPKTEELSTNTKIKEETSDCNKPQGYQTEPENTETLLSEGSRNTSNQSTIDKKPQFMQNPRDFSANDKAQEAQSPKKPTQEAQSPKTSTQEAHLLLNVKKSTQETNNFPKSNIEQEPQEHVYTSSCRIHPVIYTNMPSHKRQTSLYNHIHCKWIPPDYTLVFPYQSFRVIKEITNLGKQHLYPVLTTQPHSWQDLNRWPRRPFVEPKPHHHNKR